MQSRWKSWTLWTSLAALAAFCLKQFAGIDMDETINSFLDVLLPVLVALGVVNNPTNADKL